MKKLSSLAALACIALNPSAHALTDTDTLLITSGELECALSGTYPDCLYGITTVGAGSYFAMDTNGNGIFSNTEKIAMRPGLDGGIVLGKLQPASSAPGCSADNGSTGLIDEPWCFFANSGAHQTINTPVRVNTDGSLDFSGWGVTWNGIPNIDLGGEVALGDNGLASITCSTPACAVGDSYVLDYTAHVKIGDPSGFGGVYYGVHLEGYIGVAAPVADIKVEVSGGAVQECTATGGSDVNVSAVIITSDDDSVASVDWTVNGLPAGSGNSISAFLNLGSNTISATLTTTNGLTDVSSAIVEIKDTVAPVASADFIDMFTHSSLTNLKRFNSLRIKALAEDVCDPAPEVEAMIGAPVSDGDRMYIMKYFGNVSINLSKIDLSVRATDASGNTSKQTATINIE